MYSPQRRMVHRTGIQHGYVRCQLTGLCQYPIGRYLLPVARHGC